MSRIKALVLVGGVVGVLAILAACGNGEASDSGPDNSPDTVAPASPAGPIGPGGVPITSPLSPVIASVEGGPAPPVVAAAPEPGFSQSSASISVPVPVAPRFAPTQQTGGTEAVIFVSGEGSITLEPDLALLNVGVETSAKTVSEARGEAAIAMDAIVQALRSRGIQDADIQTRFFNISPQYEFQEVVELGRRTSKRVLIGYMVSNSTRIKIRDLDAVGPIIDEVAVAGGDAIRINGISFTVEDTKPFMTQLREDAVIDALAKAQQFASLTGVTLGRVRFISESGGGGPVLPSLPIKAFALEAVAAAPPTSVSGGQLELRLTIQAQFDIQ